METLTLDSNRSTDNDVHYNSQCKNNNDQLHEFTVKYPSNHSQDFHVDPSHDGKHVTEQEYWDIYYEDPEFKYEWKNGILEEKEMPVVGDFMLKFFFESLIDEYLKSNPIGLFCIEDIAFKLKLGNDLSIRRPDFALILTSNTNHPESTDHSYTGTYDLCVEILSDSQKKYVEKDTIIKKDEYAKVGVKEYYIIDNKQKHTAFYTLSDARKNTFKKIKPVKGVIHSKILPGFQFRIADLYLQPNLKTLIEDDVYQSYLLLDYQLQCQRAKSAEQRAESAEQRAESTEQRAESAEQSALSERKARLKAEKELERLKKMNKNN